MVREQIEIWGIRNLDVLRAMRTAPRHLFVPNAFRSEAYGYYPLPIGFGATISQPYIVAFMTQMLDPARQQRVLEIDTGSGYEAAVLAKLVSRVYTIEIVPELAETARKTLSALGYSNVVVQQGDGYEGWPSKRHLTGSSSLPPGEVPQALIAQLAIGGRLVAPVGSGWIRELVVIKKNRDGTLRRSSGPTVMFVSMRPAAK
jgi:protein-L-isoaspartate(D-aspartate) O-methyltransferase